MEHHGIGHICDEKLVQRQNAAALGYVVGNFAQRVRGAGVGPQPCVDVQHEIMEVGAVNPEFGRG